MTLSKLAKLALATTLLSFPVSLTAMQSAHATAGPGQAVHINAEGRHRCRALKSQPATYWDAKVRGEFMDNYKSNNRFVIRTCFATQSQCLHFTSRIKNYVQGIEVVRFAGCQAR